jgi:hypothetical protein
MAPRPSRKRAGDADIPNAPMSHAPESARCNRFAQINLLVVAEDRVHLRAWVTCCPSATTATPVRAISRSKSASVR